MPNIVKFTGDNRYQVQSVARAASLLNEIANHGPSGLSVTEIAGRLGVAKSTALALARTLAAAGLLRGVDPGPRYVLGLNLLRLGDLVGQQTSIAALGGPGSSSAEGKARASGKERSGLPLFLRAHRGGGLDPISRAPGSA